MNFALIEFSEDEMRRPTPHAVPLGSAKAIAGSLLLEAQMKGGSTHHGW
jgi:hypothetical protein